MFIPAAFIDQVSGGDVAKRLAKVPELEITVPNRHDRLILTAEVCKLCPQDIAGLYCLVTFLHAV